MFVAVTIMASMTRTTRRSSIGLVEDDVPLRDGENDARDGRSPRAGSPSMNSACDAAKKRGAALEELQRRAIAEIDVGGGEEPFAADVRERENRRGRRR